VIPTADPNPQPYEVVRFNALKHGILSRYTVLSHESHADYESLVNSLMDEHLPAGATEQHLIEELASVIWRKRRVLQAEGATINKGLKESARSAKTVIPAAAPFEMGLSGENTDIRNLMDLKPEDVTESQQSPGHDLDATNKASAILRKGGDRAYDKALRALLPDSREWWQELCGRRGIHRRCHGAGQLHHRARHALVLPARKRVPPPRRHREPNHWRRAASLPAGEAFPLRNPPGPQV
jgi:hypothetical protein